MAHPLPETRLLHSLLRMHGRSTDGFSVTFLSDGSVRVCGPGTASFYPAVAWTSRFLRHLRCGFFDPAAVSQSRVVA